MADRTARNRLPAAPARHAPATPTPAPIAPPIAEDVDEFEDEDAPPPPFDMATFDPDEFEWRPVARRPRADGWTPEAQRAFIEALADTGLVEDAARAVDMSVQSAYRLRRAPGAESFARAWTAALAAAAQRVLDLAFQRAIMGEETPVFDSDGRRMGARWRTNDRLTMFILRAYMPERFRHAHEDKRAAAEPAQPVLPPMADALAALVPPTPAEPHRLMAPDRLEALAEGARAVAAMPPDPNENRKRYVRPRREEDHPVALLRWRARQRREGRKYADLADEEG